MIISAQIDASNLTKLFYSNGEAITAYRDLNFQVKEGEFFCLLGPSGCGKTTLLRSLAGLESPSSGQLTINPTTTGLKVDIGMIFQGDGIFPWMTVSQNIRFLLENNPRIQNIDINFIVKNFIEKVGLTKFANYYPHQISGGMKQRVSIARSFANDPDILLMDEPFVFLDYQTRMSLQDLLVSTWQGTKKTVVFVTHDIEEAIILADRILVMTAHPGTVKKIIDINLPRPRHLHEIRKTPEYINHVDIISDMIREETQDIQQNQSKNGCK